MNLRNKIATVGAAAIFALSLGTAAFAAGVQTPVEQEIIPNGDGMLTASLGEESRMDDFTFSLDEGKATGRLVVDVKDARGNFAGWNVTLVATSFAPKGDSMGDAQPIPVSGFMVTQSRELTAITGSPNGIQAAQNVVLASEQRVLRAEQHKGTGIFKQAWDTALDIPAAQPAGTYESVVTVSVASGPGQ